MTWTFNLENDGKNSYWYTVTDGFTVFESASKSASEWLCKTLNDYESMKQKLDSLSRSVLCDNYGEC